MTGLWVLSLLLPLCQVVSGVNANQNNFRVTSSPGMATLFQVSNVNYLNQLQYAYNASKAREVCESLGVTMAAKEHVQKALDQGFETCRYGWVDEHFVVVPRIVATPACGQNMTGLRTWRAPVTQEFDVFCFNSSDSKGQWEVSTPDNPLTSRRPAEHSPPSTGAETPGAPRPRPTPARHLDQSRRLALATSGGLSSPRPPSVSPLPPSVAPSSENPEEAAEAIRNTHHSIGAVPKALLITFTCALLLTALALLCYFKRNMIRSAFLRWEAKQKQEYIETEEWTCVKKIKELHKEPAKDLKKDTDEVFVVDGVEKDTDSTPEP